MRSKIRTSHNLIALVTDAYGGYGGIAQYNRDFLSAVRTDERIGRLDVFPRLASQNEAAPEGILNHQARHQKLSYTLGVGAKTLHVKPDLIFNGHIYHSVLSAYLARWSGAKMISQLHGTEIWGEVSPKFINALDRSDLVLCVSRDTQERYRTLSKTPEDKSFLLPNTVGDVFRPADRHAARAKFGLEDEFAILTVGRIDPKKNGYKGHDRIIRALPKLRQQDRVIVYLIAGEGDDRARLERLASELGVEDQVRFLGKVPFEDLPDAYRAADLFALPSTGEGFGIVYIEAMACGTPAIGLSMGGATEALEGLGTAVSPDTFPNVLEQEVERVANLSQNDRLRLAEATQDKFGKATYQARVSEALGQVLNEQPFETRQMT